MNYNRLIRLAEQHNLLPYQEEQRYRLSLLLYYLQSLNMVFKGGTMIWFVFGGLRYSRDLDFNLDDKSERLTEEKLKKILKKAFGSDSYLKSYRESESFINAEISFPGITIPLGIKVKVEVTVPYVYLDPPNTTYFSYPEYGLGAFSYRVLDVKSVIADKVNGLLKRKHLIDVLKDTFDLWFLMRVKGYETTPQHVRHIFSITGMDFDLDHLKERLMSAKREVNTFKQYLLPSFKGRVEDVVDEVFQEVSRLYEKVYS